MGDYYVAVNSPYLLECRENVYVAFRIPEGALISADCFIKHCTRQNLYRTALYMTKVIK